MSTVSYLPMTRPSPALGINAPFPLVF